MVHRLYYVLQYYCDTLWFVFIFSEIINGIKVYDKDGQELGLSQRAAVKGITQVVTSRITMAAPGMRKCLRQLFYMGRINSNNIVILHACIALLKCNIQLAVEAHFGNHTKIFKMAVYVILAKF